jgi:hypothetical protein
VKASVGICAKIPKDNQTFVISYLFRYHYNGSKELNV